MSPLSSTVKGEAPSVSFEFFPPKTETMANRLWDTVERLQPMAPDFVSVTYGAGGSTRERTHKTVARIIAEAGLPAAAHLTCVNASKKETQRIAEKYWEAGVRHIVALRGDMPREDGTLGPFEPHPDGYANAEELVRGLKEVADFEISVSAYPECHPDAKSPQDEIDYLKRKIDAGANSGLTQYFYNADAYGYYLDALQKIGCDAPVYPGIMPILNVANLVRFSNTCGADIPRWLHSKLNDIKDDDAAVKAFGEEVVTRLCERLLAMGAPGLHFYTMNQAGPNLRILDNLGM